MKMTHLDSVFATRERRGRDISPGLAVEEARGETHFKNSPTQTFQSSSHDAGAGHTDDDDGLLSEKTKTPAPPAGREKGTG